MNVLARKGEHVEVRREIIAPLLSWFKENARELPWRENKDPYRIWVSEIMLQQTRVEAVKPYYKRFIESLPDITHLAKIPEDQLLKLWEGLGYYNRVRNMQKAAQIVVEQYQGVMPRTYEELLMLPGIGTYTAGAIASIAYGEMVPAVDGNVLRVIARVEADKSDIADPKVKKELEIQMASIMPKEAAGDFNQGLMELGATVCVPNGAPLCTKCPWSHICKVHKRGEETSLPIKSPKKKRVIEEKTILVIQDDENIVIQKRPSKGLLAGLYEFPALEGFQKREKVIEYMKNMGLPAIRVTQLEESKHLFTHREWHMIGYYVRVDELARKTLINPMWQLVDLQEVENSYAIPAALGKYTKHVDIKLGQEKYI